jgi:hypothetical protein
MAVKELSNHGLSFDLISKFCKKNCIAWDLRFPRRWFILSGVAEGGHRRFEGTYVSISALYRWRHHVPLLVGTHLPQHKCRNSEDHNITVLTIAKIQLLCIWYMSAHHRCLSILVLSRLQEKSARRSAVRLESLNNSVTLGGGGGQATRGVGCRWEVRSQPYQEPRMQVKFV